MRFPVVLVTFLALCCFCRTPVSICESRWWMKICHTNEFRRVLRSVRSLRVAIQHMQPPTCTCQVSSPSKLPIPHQQLAQHENQHVLLDPSHVHHPQHLPNVHPAVEYACVAWSPNKKELITLIDSVQCKFKFDDGLHGLGSWHTMQTTGNDWQASSSCAGGVSVIYIMLII